MKNLMTTVFAFLLLLPSAFSDTWLGGNGQWNVPSNWVDGTVPTANDEVHIGSGIVQIPAWYIAYAKKVTVDYNATLLIDDTGGRLIIDAQSNPNNQGLVINGTVNVLGGLIVRNVHDEDAIYIYEGSLEIEQGAYLTLRDISGDSGRGIKVMANSFFTNEGYASIRNTGSTGIDNYGTCFSSGTILFQNIESGAIICYIGSFTNEGDITVKGANSAVIVSSGGYFLNTHSGEITGSYLVIMINVLGSNLSHFDNHGSIKAEWGHFNTGIKVSGTFINHSAGEITIYDGTFSPINIEEDGTFSNYGQVDISTDGQYVVYNKGLLQNKPCGTLNLHNEIFTNSQGTISNEGVIYNLSTGLSFNYGSCINEGVIEDNFGGLSPVFTNNEIVVNKILGNVQARVGEPLDHVLKMGKKVDHYTVRGFYTSPSLTTSAGNYDYLDNEWIPNNDAEGLSSVYMVVEYRVNLSIICSHVVRLDLVHEVEGPNAPMAAPAISSITTQYDESNVYPNPFHQDLNIQFPGTEEGTHLLRIMAIDGQMLLQQTIEVNGASTTTLALPQLLNGSYLLTLQSPSGKVSHHKIVKSY